MTTLTRLLAGVAAAALLAKAPSAESRRIPFVPERVRHAIRAEIDGVAAHETVRELGRFHRVHGSPGYAAAAEHVRGKAVAAGLTDAVVERFPADGTARYAHFRSYLGWTAESGVLEEVAPRARTIARFPDLAVALADYSQDADVTAELVDVGPGTRPSDYAGKRIEGRIVIASGALPAVHRMAIDERGALGFLSDFPNQTTAWSGDDRDLVRWGHLDPYHTKNRFAFMLSKRQAQELRTRLVAGERVTVRARVRARMTAASLDVVNASIPGSDAAAGEVILTAHLCHQIAGANDNASGSAAILEVARALQAAIAKGTLPRPRRTIRFLWTPEISGAQVWLVRHPEHAARAVAGIHMDMVGGLLSTTRGTFHLSRTAESLPHALNAVAQAFFDEVVDASAGYAEHGGDAYAGLVWPPGSREAFLGDVRGIEMGSDHQVYQDSSFGIPMVYFHDWPDVNIHTNKDQPENLDPTKLGRVAYMGAGIAWTLAALPDEEAGRVLTLVRADGERRLIDADLRGLEIDDARDAALVRREAVMMAIAAADSVGRLWPDTRPHVRDVEAALRARVPVVPAPVPRDARVPVRSDEVKGPLELYYYDHLAQALEASDSADPAGGAGSAASPALAARDNGEVLAYEALNLADGRRSISEIRDVLTGRYGPVPLGEVAEYFELLERTRVVVFR